jgi:hypothetical protein
MRQKYTLSRATPLLWSAALFVLPVTASYAQGMQDQKQQPAQSQQAPAATPAQTQQQQPSRAQQQPQGQAPATTAQQPQQPAQQQTQTPATGQQQPSSAQQPSSQQAPAARQPSTAQQPATQQPSTAQQPATASLTDQQRSKLGMSISQGNVQRLSSVNFSINVGSTVPASTRLYPVTRAMIDVYPQYRGYSFMVVNDEVVIVEPRTKRIVEVVMVGGGQRSTVASQPTMKSKLNLTQKQRDVIRSSVRRTKAPVTTGAATTVEKEITIGDRLPETVVIERFPNTVYRSVPSMRSYHYITRDRGVYVVDPRERTVIDLID